MPLPTKIFQEVQAVLKRSRSSGKLSDRLSEIVSPTSFRVKKKQAADGRDRTLVRHSSQSYFKEKNQTAIVLDWDDTLFPTTYLSSHVALDPTKPPDQQTHMEEEERKEVLGKIEECQDAAESLLRCAHNFGRVIIATLSHRNKLKKNCETWYPRVWKLLHDFKITIVYAQELPKPKEEAPRIRKEGGVTLPEELAAYQFAWVKGRAIGQELDRFYSQYEGQSWKNVISIGDSDYERYGTLGAASAYVQKRFRDSRATESSAYSQLWERLDKDPHWSGSLEGVHEGRLFKVRTKVMKLTQEPSATDCAQQLKLLLPWLPLIVCFDGCLNLVLEDLTEKTTQSIEAELMASPHVKKPVDSELMTLPGSCDLEKSMNPGIRLDVNVQEHVMCRDVKVEELIESL